LILRSINKLIFRSFLKRIWSDPPINGSDQRSNRGSDQILRVQVSFPRPSLLRSSWADSVFRFIAPSFCMSLSFLFRTCPRPGPLIKLIYSKINRSVGSSDQSDRTIGPGSGIGVPRLLCFGVQVPLPGGCRGCPPT